MRLDYNSSEALAPVIEALLFASDEPLSAQDLRSLILGEEPVKTAVEQEAAVAEPIEEPQAEFGSIQDSDQTTSADGEVAAQAAPAKTRKRKQPIELPVVHQAIELLNETYISHDRAFHIIEIAGGYQFATRSEYSEYVARLFKERSRRRLSGAALETLAIIAYKQPVSKLDVENIRGVNCDEVLKSLLEKNLITITGRAEAVGRPLLYGTTIDFLRHFGLPDLRDLPKPRELEELMKEESIRATTLEEAAQEFVTPGLDEGFGIEEAIVYAHASGETMNEDEEEISGIELDVEAMISENTNDESENFNG
jgi:segregation and condensation protein B